MWGGLVHTLASDKVPRAEHLNHDKLDVIQSSDMRPLFEELGMHRHCMAILQCLDTQHAPLAWHQCCLCAYHSLGVQLKVAVLEISFADKHTAGLSCPCHPSRDIVYSIVWWISLITW